MEGDAFLRPPFAYLSLSFRIGGLCGNGTSFKGSGARAFCIPFPSSQGKEQSPEAAPTFRWSLLQEPGAGCEQQGLVTFLSLISGCEGRTWVNQSFLYGYGLWWGVCTCRLWTRPTWLVCDEEKLLVCKGKLARWTKVWRKDRWGSPVYGGNCSTGGEGVLRRDSTSSMSSLVGFAACPWFLLRGFSVPHAEGAVPTWLHILSADGAAVVPAERGRVRTRGLGDFPEVTAEVWASSGSESQFLQAQGLAYKTLLPLVTEK